MEPALSGSLHFELVRHESDRARFSALLDRAFAVGGGRHFLDDFPVWDERFAPTGDRVARIGVRAGDELVAAAGVRRAELATTGGRLPVAIIGAVCTDERWRGRGYGSRVVSTAMLWARDQGAAMILLWGSEASMYRRLGFEYCGTQVRVAAKALPPARADAEVRRGWDERLFSALRARGSGLALDSADIGWLAAHRNTQWFWLERDGAVAAYAAYGRGIDLPGMIHEWGGEPADLSRVLGALRVAHPQAQLLASPGLARARGFAWDVEEPLCLAQVLEPRAVLEALRPGERVSAREGADDLWELGLGARRLAGVAPGALAPAIFGCSGAGGTPGLGLELWLWGLDGA
jgi:predicted N-acetyltransferase YhbS